MIKTPSIALLESGYWHVRWNDNQWLQWLKGERPTIVDAFGWVSLGMLRQAESLVASNGKTGAG